MEACEKKVAYVLVDAMGCKKWATLMSYSAPLPWDLPSLKIATPGIIDKFYAQPISADELGRAPARWRAAFEGKADNKLI